MDNIIDIISYSSDGNGVGRKDGSVFFVPYAIKDEKVKVKELEKKKNIINCELLCVVEQSKMRIEPQCPHFYNCGGCTYQNISYNHQLEIKEDKINNAIKRIGHLENKVSELIPSDYIYNYRNKAIIPVGYDENNKVVCGFYKNKSYNICPMSYCNIHNEKIFKIANIITKWMNDFNIKPYNRKNKTGVVKNIFVRTSVSTNEIMAGVILKYDDMPCKDELIKRLKEENITSLFYNVNAKDNKLMSSNNTLLYGRGYIEDEILKVKFKIGIESFYQVNPYTVEKLYKKVIDLLELNKNDVIFDLYCGIGTIGLCLSDKVKKVYGIEYVDEAVKYARENSDYNNIENCEFYSGKCEEVIFSLLSRKIKPTKIVLDPPRSGCDKKLIDAILKLEPEKICYVSCDPATMARDIKILTESGKYKTDVLYGCDMFPQSFHVECIATLSLI